MWLPVTSVTPEVLRLRIKKELLSKESLYSVQTADRRYSGRGCGKKEVNINEDYIQSNGVPWRDRR